MNKENFTYSCGWKTAPETYRFYHNGRRLNLPPDIERKLGYQIICGDFKAVEDELKRQIRKQRKRGTVAGWCVGYCVKGSATQYYFSQQLMFDRNNIKDALRNYKEWKRFVAANNLRLKSQISMTTGCILSNGTKIGNAKEDEGDLVDLSRPVLIKIVYPRKYLVERWSRR